jgi:cell wall-associated NlpC family hydrolase
MINKLIEEARKYLGVPWKHQGRTMNGVDCVGFLILAFKALDIPILEIKGYSRNPDGVALKKIMDDQPNFIEVPKSEIRPGDILLFKIRKHPQHVALVVPSNTGDLGIIHSYNGGMKKVIEHNLADYWRTRIISAYRLTDKWQQQ